tara:strand:- start:183 stop:2498 length:2316 start_codon:yes stop_codon:yes gene_type:complete
MVKNIALDKEKSYSSSFNNEDSIFDNNQSEFNLKNTLELFARRKKIFTFLVLTFFTVSCVNLLYRRLTRPIYRGSFVIMISDPFISERTTADGGYSLESLALNQNKSDIPTLISYLKSPKLLKNITQKYDLPSSSLLGRVKISINRIDGARGKQATNTLLVTMEGDNKKVMEDVINKLSYEYVIAAATARKKQISQGIKFLSEEQLILLERVRDTQKKLVEFRLRNQTLDPITEGAALRDTINLIEAKEITLKSENIRLDFIKENLDNGILHTRGIDSRLIESDSNFLGVFSSDQLLLDEMLSVKVALAKAQSKYKDSSIVVKNLKEKLSQLEPLLLEKQKAAVKAAITVNNGLMKSLKNKLLESKKTFAPMPKIVTEYSVIVKALESLETNLLALSQTKDKLQLELSQEILPWQIISDPSIEATPIKPDIKRNLIYISFFTFFFSTLIIYLIDRLDYVFHNTSEVENFIDLPILGFVPFFKFKPKELLASDEEGKEVSENSVFKDENFFIFEETFRNIYTSIKFSNIDKKINTVALSSSVPGEGKSLCTVFLAINVSEISKKVLIIDSDLRRPNLHKNLNVDNISGLSNFLVNNESKWEDFVTQHEKYKNLSYMTAGKVPPNSVRLLESERMKSLIEDLKDSNKFDLIIFDCPPILGLADSLIISNLVDGIIINLSLNKVDRNLVVETIKKVKSLDPPVLGLIINSINPSKKESFENKYFTKYMPLETTDRYGIKNNNNEENSLDKKITKSNFKKKLNEILIKFKDWINE